MTAEDHQAQAASLCNETVNAANVAQSRLYTMGVNPLFGQGDVTAGPYTQFKKK